MEPTRHRVWPPRFSIRALMLLVCGAALATWYAAWEYHQSLRRNFVSVSELVAHYNEVVAKPSEGRIAYLTNAAVFNALRSKSKHANLSWLPLGSHIHVEREDVGMRHTILLDGRHRPEQRTSKFMPPLAPKTHVLLNVRDPISGQPTMYELASYSAIPMNIANLPPRPAIDAQWVRRLLLSGIILVSLAVSLTVTFRRAALKGKQH